MSLKKEISVRQKNKRCIIYHCQSSVSIFQKVISRAKNIIEEQFSKGSLFPPQKDLRIRLMYSLYITTM